jgi:ubiquitin-protein ligase E3 A
LDYDKEEPLEDVLARTFTIDYEVFGDKVTEELKEGGKDIFVSKANREEFINLYIEHLFEKQCKVQIEYFRKGFFRLFDRDMLYNLYSAEELEQFVCGTKNLDFRQLQKVTKYIRPLNPDHEIAKWFWDIVFNEFDDDQRKRLLAFTTGSDRAPITGLEDVEFILGLEGEDEEKLPVAHTCFNQLLFPVYKSREKLMKKLK